MKLDVVTDGRVARRTELRRQGYRCRQRSCVIESPLVKATVLKNDQRPAVERFSFKPCLDVTVERRLMVKQECIFVPRDQPVGRLVGLGEVRPFLSLREIDEDRSLLEPDGAEQTLPESRLFRSDHSRQISDVHDLLNPDDPLDLFERRRKDVDYARVQKSLLNEAWDLDATRERVDLAHLFGFAPRSFS